jgi:hypothetical protein
VRGPATDLGRLKANPRSRSTAGQALRGLAVRRRTPKMISTGLGHRSVEIMLNRCSEAD